MKSLREFDCECCENGDEDEDSLMSRLRGLVILTNRMFHVMFHDPQYLNILCLPDKSIGG